MFILYDLLYLIAFILYCPVLLVRKKFHRGYVMRLGFLSKELQNNIRYKDNIWLHAVSVGEVAAINDLIGMLRKKHPSYQIVLSTVTKTGFELANKQLKGKAVIVFAPLDLSWIVRKYVRLIVPKIFVAAETEIWPNLYRFLDQANIPIVQVNGRISDGSYAGYKRFRFLIENTLKRVDLFCMQSQLDCDRIIEIGAPQGKVRITGNIKFDNLPKEEGVSRASLGYNNDDEILIAGSTHPGEEAMILEVWEQLLQEGRESLKLVISPRHVERANEVKEIVEARGYRAVLISEYTDQKMEAHDVLIVDRIGVLKDLYSIATVVFIGKSFTVGGAQNMIEPAFFGKPTLVGPKTYNFKDVVRIFLSEDALIQVVTKEELLGQIRSLLEEPDKRQSIGRRAGEVVKKYQGASLRTLEFIEEILNK